MSSPALSHRQLHPSYHPHPPAATSQNPVEYGQPAPAWLDTASIASGHRRQHSAASTASHMASPAAYASSERGSVIYEEAQPHAGQDSRGVASTSMGKQDSMYNALPTYRFPSAPSPAPSVSTPQQYSPSHSPSLSFRSINSGSSLQQYQENQQALSRKLQPALELGGPPLPSISMADEQAQDTPSAPSVSRFQGYRDYDSRTSFPGGLVSTAEGEPYDVITPGSLEANHPTSSSTEYLGVSYAPTPEMYQGPMIPTAPAVVASPGLTGSAPANPVGYTTYSSSTTHTHTTSSSTFVPSSAYLPSKSAFSGMSPALPASTGMAPRSAPSTPLGRQDARFLSHTRAWTTPEPLVSSYFPSKGSPSPLIAQSPATLTSSVPPSFRLNASTSSSSSSFYPSHDLEKFHLSSSTASSKPEEDYIPYARPVGPKSKRAPPPFAPTTPVMHVPMKKVKREKTTPKITKLPSPAAGSSAAGSPAPSAQNEEEEKPTRVKIACNACRKTRLKCDGLQPCTSCIDKYLKMNPQDLEREAGARRHIEATNSCVYEATVRRRGKGKKTLAKERYQLDGRSMSPSSIGSPNILGSSVSSLSSSMNGATHGDERYPAYMPHFVSSQPSPAVQDYHPSPYLSPHSYPQHQQHSPHQYHQHSQYPSNQHLQPTYPSHNMHYGLGVGLDHSGRHGSSEHGSAAADDY